MLLQIKSQENAERLLQKIKIVRLTFSYKQRYNWFLGRYNWFLGRLYMQNRPGKINFDHSPPFFDTKPLRQKPLFPGFGSLCTVLPTLCHHWTNRPPLLCKRKETINQGPLHTKIKLSWTGNALSKSSSSTRNSRARFRIPQNPRDGQFENRWFIFLNRSTNESYQKERENFVFRAVHMQDRFAASVAQMRKPAGRKHEPVVDETSGIPSEGH